MHNIIYKMRICIRNTLEDILTFCIELWVLFFRLLLVFHIPGTFTAFYEKFIFRLGTSFLYYSNLHLKD